MWGDPPIFFINTTAERFINWLRHRHLENFVAPITFKILDYTRCVLLDPLGIQRDPEDGTRYVQITMRGYREPGGVLPFMDFPAITFDLLDLAKERIQVEASCHVWPVLPYFMAFLKDLATTWPEAAPVLDEYLARPLPADLPQRLQEVLARPENAALAAYLLPEDQPRPDADRTPVTRGPTERTRQLAAIFKRLHDAHPEWEQWRVAQEACQELAVCDITTETVRNAYRAMRRAGIQGFEWGRPNLTGNLPPDR